MTARGEPLIEGLQNFGPDLAKAATQLKLVADRMGYSVDGNHPEFGRHIADILGAISEVMTGHGDAAIKEVLVSANEALKALENIKIDFRPGPKTDETTVQIRATVMSGVEERMNREGGSRRDNIQAFLDDLAVKPRKTELELAILATVNGFPDPIPNIEQWFKRSRRIKRNRRTKSTN
jgi:hypothetical protein